MDSETFISVYNCVEKSQCDLIIERFESALKRTVTLPTSDNSTERKDIVLFSDAVPQVEDIIVRAMNECLSRYREEYHCLDSLGQISSDEIKLQKTEPRGGFHKWHCEAARVATAKRVLAWTLYLNDIPEGEGETEFVWQGVRIAPKAGNFAIWPAAFTHVHRGNPVYSCDKYIATGWFSLIK